MRPTILAAAAALALAGCAANVSPRIQPLLAKAPTAAPIACQNECKIEWQRAQIWLSSHSKWKIQAATDVLLETYNPVGSDVSYGFTVTKAPQADGSYVIRMGMVCGNMFGCDPLPQDVLRAFYHYVSTGEDLLAGAGYLSAIR